MADSTKKIMHMNPTGKITLVWELLCDSMKDQTQSERVVHLSWLLLFKYLDYYEAFAEAQAEQKGEQYISIIEKGWRWSDWVSRAFDLSDSVAEDNSLHGDQLIEFLRQVLFPHLCNFWISHCQLPLQKTLASIFCDSSVPICASENVLLKILEIVDSIDFQQPDVVPAIISAYEGLLQQVTINDTLARDFITPASLIHSLIEVVNPQPGEKIYDPACGTGGFLIEAYKHMREKSVSDTQGVQVDEIYGNALDKTSALLCATRMSLSEIPVAQIYHGDALQGNSIRFDKSSRLIIITNPPFGVVTDEEVKQNNSLETAYNIPLFLNHYMDIQAESGGTTSVIVPRKALEASSLAFVKMRARLLKDFNLLMVVGLPPHTFANTAVEATILIFEASGPTRETFYYDMNLLLGDASPQQPVSEDPFTLVRKAWEVWQKYIKGTGPRPERTTASWIEAFDDEKFQANQYQLGMERPSTFKYTKLPPPLELTNLLLANRQQLHQAANMQKPSLEPTHHFLQSNQQFQQHMRSVRDNLAKMEKKDDRDN